MMESFALVARLYEEQCEPPKGEKPKRIELQLAETCVEENPFQVITAVDVNGANESDQQQVKPILEQTVRSCGAAPDEMHGDAGYASGENIVMAREEHGTELKAPIGSNESKKYLPLTEFEFNAEGTEVLQCPTGKAPVRHQPSRNGKAVMAIYSAAQCNGCPLRHVCPTDKRRDGRHLRFTKADVAVARRRVEQETAEFKERHKIRSGIEATNSEMKRRHGLGELRVRGRPRVGLSVRLKALALNIKRFVAHVTDVAIAATEPVPAYAN